MALRAQLFQHLAAMEQAGLPADRAYALLDLGAGGRARLASFRRLLKRQRDWDPVSAGLGSGLLTVFEACLLRAALAAGSPLPAYRRLAAQHAATAAQRATLRTRLMLPGAILVLAMLVNLLPAPVGGSLSIGAYLWRVGAPLLMLAALVLAAARVAAWHASGAPHAGARAGRALLDRALLALPLFGAMHLRRNARDFTDSLALLLEAGLPLFEALPVALDTVGNGIVRADLAGIIPAVTQGATLAQAVAALRLVDTAALFALVHTGEQSGTLAAMLARHAQGETAAIDHWQRALAEWLPRLFYALVAAWMVVQLLAAAPPGMPQ